MVACRCNTARRDPNCTIHHPLSELLVDMAFPGLDRGPEAPEPCEECGGEGEIVILREAEPTLGQVTPHSHSECPRCLGTGVQP